MAEWLRLACNFAKRHSQGTRMSNYIEDTAQGMIEEIVQQVMGHDPVTGNWGGGSMNQQREWFSVMQVVLRWELF